MLTIGSRFVFNPSSIYPFLTYFQLPRGVRGYKLLGGGDFTHWKVTGNVGGEDFPDKVRGIFNEGGLFVERQGWCLITSTWTVR